MRKRASQVELGGEAYAQYIRASNQKASTRATREFYFLLAKQEGFRVHTAFNLRCDLRAFAEKLMVFKVAIQVACGDTCICRGGMPGRMKLREFLPHSANCELDFEELRPHYLYAEAFGHKRSAVERRVCAAYIFKCFCCIRLW